MTITNEQVVAGQAVYTRRALAAYDLVVLGISNRLIWRCPTARLLTHYDQLVSDNHLDVGVGSGYFLDRCQFASSSPRVALMDLNSDALQFAASRIHRYQPEIYRCNVLEPISIQTEKFESVAVNYLLHCLPGTMKDKAIVFDHLIDLMNPGATLFGSTLLQGGVRNRWVARRLMRFYNRKGIFSNESDDLADLTAELHSRFQQVRIEVVGSAALFSGRTN